METIERDPLLVRANLLALLTIGYNFVEGIISMALGAADETLALFGFGVDSFIEVISAVGVWHMINREGQHSIRINDQWRICFKWLDGSAYDVEIVDYH